MARPNKFNLQYFPMDVDFFDDHKLISIEEASGIKGGYIALRLMAMVYSDKGYYMDWPENFEYTAAKRIGNGITAALVGEVFRLCLKNKLFDVTVFEKYQVVTSAGIQKRWYKVMQDLRRKAVINVDYWLVSSEETGITSEETPINVAESTQKEKKGNEIKKNEVLAPEAPPTQNLISSDPVENKPERKKNAGPRRSFVRDNPPTHPQVKEYFSKHTDWPEDVCHNEALAYIGHYTGNGWVQGKDKPLISWQGACTTWIVNKKKGNFEPPRPAAPPSPAGYQRETPKRIPEKQMPSIERDINYLFDLYKEDPAKVTTISVESTFYDHMKARGMFNFSEDIVSEIVDQASEFFKAKEISPDEKMMNMQKKKLAVLYYFKEKFKNEPAYTIFN